MYSAADSFSLACPCSRVTPALETRRRLEEVTLIDRVRIELERHPEFRRLSDFGEVEHGTDDADDFVWIAAELNRLPDDVGIAAEPARPQPVAEHGDAGTPGRSSSRENVRPLNTGAPKSLK